MKNKKNNKNINCGNKIIGPTNMIGQIIVNPVSAEKAKNVASYETEPLWRSPFTLAVLSWVGVIIGILGFFPVGNILGSILALFNSSFRVRTTVELQLSIWVFLITMVLFAILVKLRRIAEMQVRYPLFCNLAISGYGKRIVIEKIHIPNCPICGGKMRYYNKPVEWVNYYRDGKMKHEVTKRIPFFECKRNVEHCFKVDPAEDKVG